MNINTDINILGSILDLNLINNVLQSQKDSVSGNTGSLSNTKLKTTRSLQRYERAIKNTLVYFNNGEVSELFGSVIFKDGLSENCLALLFLNASYNNDLLDYFNHNIFFPAFFGGRIAIKKDEIIACINDLKQSEVAVKEWSDSTIDVVARKYLALLEKFYLLEGGRYKTIRHKYIDDNQLILFLYWLIKIESKSNLLESKWLPYCFLDNETFIKQVLQKKYMKYINVIYTGDSMILKTLISYKDIYNELTKS